MNKLCWSAVHCVRVVLAQHFDLNMYDVISMRNFFFFIPVKSIIDEEIKSGIPSDRIVLGNLCTLSTHIFTSTHVLCTLFRTTWGFLHYELEENYSKLLHEAGYFWSQDMPLESWLCYNYTTCLILLMNWYQGLKIKKQFTLNLLLFCRPLLICCLAFQVVFHRVVLLRCIQPLPWRNL